MDSIIEISDAIYIAIGSKPSEFLQISGNSLSSNFLCICENSEKLFVKIYHSKNSTFLMQQSLYLNDIPIPRPIHELCIGQNSFCAIYEYITAQPASFFLGHSCEKELAVIAAENLRKMHTLKLNHAKKYEDTCCEIQALVNYINVNAINFAKRPEICDYLLSNTVNVPKERVGIVHMDFHLKNILVSNKKKDLFFTDFENLSYCDIWRDFVYAVLFHEPVEKSFWESFIQSYFDNNIPQQFWEVTKYYCYVQLLRMIVCEYKKENPDAIDKLAKSVYAGFPISSSYPNSYFI